MDEKSHISQFCEVKLSLEKDNQHQAHLFFNIFYFFLNLMSVSMFVQCEV